MGGAVILNWVLGAIIIVVIIGGGVYAILYHGKAPGQPGSPSLPAGQSGSERHAPG